MVRRILVMAVWLLPCGEAAAAPLDVCDVLKHLNRYEGREVELRGVFVPDSTALYPEKHCRAPHEAFLLRPSDSVSAELQSAQGSGKRGRQLSGVFVGTIGGWEAPRKHGRRAPVFSVTRVSGIHHHRK